MLRQCLRNIWFSLATFCGKNTLGENQNRKFREGVVEVPMFQVVAAMAQVS